MANVKESLGRLSEIEGFLGACIVDASSGMVLGQTGGGVNLEVAAATNTEVVRAKLKAIKALNLNDRIEDILITLGKQYHLIRPLSKKNTLFFYVVLDRVKSNLAMGRFVVQEAEREIEF